MNLDVDREKASGNSDSGVEVVDRFWLWTVDGCAVDSEWWSE